MSLHLPEGTILVGASKNKIIDHLRSRDSKTIECYANSLKIIIENNTFILLHKEKNQTFSYPVRKTFLYKLLKWYNISHHNIHHFSNETLLGICNDNLKAISNKNKSIYLLIEDNDVISIVSQYYTSISDLEVINLVDKCNTISSISRDDFCMRIITEIKSKAEPIKGDICGFGLNITNSQTGFATLQAEHYILRYWCTNGATRKIKGKHINVVHYGQNKQTIFAKLEDVIKNAPQEPDDFIRGVQESFRKKATYLFPTINYKVNAIISNYQGYTFFKKFDEKNANYYDLFNYITDTAKSYSVLERYRLEQLAGDLLY